jgi:hypothetical protein
MRVRLIQACGSSAPLLRRRCRQRLAQQGGAHVFAAAAPTLVLAALRLWMPRTSASAQLRRCSRAGVPHPCPRRRRGVQACRCRSRRAAQLQQHRLLLAPPQRLSAGSPWRYRRIHDVGAAAFERAGAARLASFCGLCRGHNSDPMRVRSAQLPTPTAQRAPPARRLLRPGAAWQAARRCGGASSAVERISSTAGRVFWRRQRRLAAHQGARASGTGVDAWRARRHGAHARARAAHQGAAHPAARRGASGGGARGGPRGGLRQRAQTCGSAAARRAGERERRCGRLSWAARLIEGVKTAECARAPVAAAPSEDAVPGRSSACWRALGTLRERRTAAAARQARCMRVPAARARAAMRRAAQRVASAAPPRPHPRASKMSMYLAGGGAARSAGGVSSTRSHGFAGPGLGKAVAPRRCAARAPAAPQRAHRTAAA